MCVCVCVCVRDEKRRYTACTYAGSEAPVPPCLCSPKHRRLCLREQEGRGRQSPRGRPGKQPPRRASKRHSGPARRRRCECSRKGGRGAACRAVVSSVAARRNCWLELSSSAVRVAAHRWGHGRAGTRTHTRPVESERRHGGREPSQSRRLWRAGSAGATR